MGKTERKTTLRRPRCRWNGYVKICLKEIGQIGLNSSGTGQICGDLLLIRKQMFGFHKKLGVF